MSKKSKIIIRKAKNKQLFLTIKSPNNKTLAHTETYKTNQGVNNAAKALKRVLKNAEIIDKREKGK